MDLGQDQVEWCTGGMPLAVAFRGLCLAAAGTVMKALLACGGLLSGSVAEVGAGAAGR